MNKKDKLHLRLLAKELPPVFKTKRVVYGSQLLDAGVKYVQGESVKPNKKYVGEFPDPEEHYKNLVKSYRKGGAEECKKYVELVKATYNKQKQEANNI